MSEAKKGKSGHPAWNKGLPSEKQPSFGFKHSDKTKRKISENRKGKGLNNRARLGMMAWNKGKKMPSISGKLNYRWKGGYENHLWHNRQRRVKRLGNGGFHTLGEWETLKAQYNWTCPACNNSEPQIKLTVDHIIPLSRGGSDNIENIQPLCRTCNFKKHTNIVRYKFVKGKHKS